MPSWVVLCRSDLVFVFSSSDMLSCSWSIGYVYYWPSICRSSSLAGSRPPLFVWRGNADFLTLLSLFRLPFVCQWYHVARENERYVNHRRGLLALNVLHGWHNLLRPPMTMRDTVHNLLWLTVSIDLQYCQSITMTEHSCCKIATCFHRQHLWTDTLHNQLWQTISS